MKKKAIWAALLGALALILACIALLRRSPARQDIWFDEQSSCFSDFYFHEETGTVDFICQLVFENRTNRDVKFQIRADFSREKEIGLISDTLLQAVDEATGERFFAVPPHERACFRVKFTASHAGGWQKADRNLPDHITVIPAVD